MLTIKCVMKTTASEVKTSFHMYPTCDELSSKTKRWFNSEQCIRHWPGIESTSCDIFYDHTVITAATFYTLSSSILLSRRKYEFYHFGLKLPTLY